MSKSDGLNNGKDSGVVPLVPQAHGGALKAGGTPGNRGNVNSPGRPRTRIRTASALAYEERIPVLTDIADDKNEKAGDRIRALDVLGRIGLSDDGDKVNEDLVREMAGVVRGVLQSAPDGDKLLEAIYEGWKPVIAKRL
ncbi:MAG: hypothetical protein O2956_13760 [Gemmatimonadetes bacterium]|nr:hypothetical protein [Gemmatimonadota bacterium]